MCHNSRRAIAFSPVTLGALSDICHRESLEIHCSRKNSLMLVQEQQVPFTLVQKSQCYKQHCTFLSTQLDESARVRRMPAESQALHWAPEGVLRGPGPTQHCSIFSRERDAQDPAMGSGPRSPLPARQEHREPRVRRGSIHARPPARSRPGSGSRRPGGAAQASRSAPRTAAGPPPPPAPAPFRMSSSLSGS